MQDTTVAVTGISGFLGRRLLPLLTDDPSVGRIVGLDVREPERRSRRLEMHCVDIASHELKPLLEGVDVIVHLAAVVDPIADDALMARVNVHGTRRVLEAAGAVGVRKIVRVSTAAAYGAWSTNPLPITEDAPLRPNPGFGPAIQAVEVERLLLEWRDEHPSAIVTTLRAAPILGAGAAHLFARLLTSPARVRVRNEAPPVQAVHADDVASALALLVREDHSEVLNVAADGWLAAEDAAALVPRPVVPALPADVLRRLLARLWVSGVADVPPSVLPYLIHPWAVANDRLRALGWEPRYTNEEAILETADALAPFPVTPARLAVAGGVATAALTGAAVAWARRSRR
jgi:nucleoside-diphosphate-sugar epimerase